MLWPEDDPDAARLKLRHVLTIEREHGIQISLPWALVGLGRIALLAGDAETPHDFLMRDFAFFREAQMKKASPTRPSRAARRSRPRATGAVASLHFPC